MANPTTNYGWVMPNSADLVTDLPADFAVFGQGVDTSMQYLLGGTTGQVLSKTSATNMAFTWTTPTDQVPLTTKGDLFTFTTVDARLGVGSNNQTLYADSTALTGLAWGASSKSTLTTTGDIIYASAANTPARLGIGTTGQSLVVAAGVPSWATASSGTKIGQVVQTFLSTTFSTASSSYTDLTGVSVSITPTLNTSKILIFVSITESTSTGAAGNTFFQILRGATAIGNSTGVSIAGFSSLAGAMMPTSGSIDTNCVFLDSPATTSATTYKIQMKNDGGYTAYINRRGADTNSGGVSTITVMEVVV